MKHLKFAFYLVLSIILFNSCQKEYSIGSKANNTKVSIGSWQFKDSSTLFTGTMDSAYIDSSNSTKVLHLIGTSQNGIQNFQLLLYGNTFTTGTYKASLFQTTFLYSSGSSTIYQAVTSTAGLEPSIIFKRVRLMMVAELTVPEECEKVIKKVLESSKIKIVSDQS